MPEVERVDPNALVFDESALGSARSTPEAPAGDRFAAQKRTYERKPRTGREPGDRELLGGQPRPRSGSRPEPIAAPVPEVTIPTTRG